MAGIDERFIESIREKPRELAIWGIWADSMDDRGVGPQERIDLIRGHIARVALQHRTAEDEAALPAEIAKLSLPHRTEAEMNDIRQGALAGARGELQRLEFLESQAIWGQQIGPALKIINESISDIESRNYQHGMVSIAMPPRFSYGHHDNFFGKANIILSVHPDHITKNAERLMGLLPVNLLSVCGLNDQNIRGFLEREELRSVTKLAIIDEYSTNSNQEQVSNLTLVGYEAIGRALKKNLENVESINVSLYREGGSRFGWQELFGMIAGNLRDDELHLKTVRAKHPLLGADSREVTNYSRAEIKAFYSEYMKDREGRGR